MRKPVRSVIITNSRLEPETLEVGYGELPDSSPDRKTQGHLGIRKRGKTSGFCKGWIRGWKTPEQESGGGEDPVR